MKIENVARELFRKVITRDAIQMKRFDLVTSILWQQKDVRTRFARNARILMALDGETRASLSKRIGYNASYMSRLLSGEPTCNPSFIYLASISQTLRMPIFNLVFTDIASKIERMRTKKRGTPL